jgi:hypothetical protein
MYRNPTHYKTLTSLALVASIVLVLCFSLSAKSDNSQATGLEYKVISRAGTMKTLNQADLRRPEALAEAIETILNNLGKEGWELLEANESLLILKRKLP